MGKSAKLLILSLAVGVPVVGGILDGPSCWAKEYDYNVVVEGPLWLRAQACFDDPLQA
jgi:hypothetical protein